MPNSKRDSMILTNSERVFSIKNAKEPETKETSSFSNCHPIKNDAKKQSFNHFSFVSFFLSFEKFVTPDKNPWHNKSFETASRSAFSFWRMYNLQQTIKDQGFKQPTREQLE